MASTDMHRTRTAPEKRAQLLSRASSLRRARSIPEDGSQQYYSPQFMDDHGAHQYYASATQTDEFIDVGMDAPQSPISDETMSATAAEASHEEEVRFGVVNTRDLEAGPTRPDTIREKSIRSVKDPNLVSSHLSINILPMATPND